MKKKSQPKKKIWLPRGTWSRNPVTRIKESQKAINSKTICRKDKAGKIDKEMENGD